MAWAWIGLLATLGCGNGGDTGRVITDLNGELVALCYAECERREACDSNEYETVERCKTYFCDASSTTWTDELFPLTCAHYVAFIEAVETCQATDCPAGGTADCWSTNEAACGT